MTDPTPPHRRSPMEHERDACPYCDERALSVAWMAGAEHQRDKMRDITDALTAERDKLRKIIREAHDAMKDGADATAWAFLRAAVEAEDEARAALKEEESDD